METKRIRCYICNVIIGYIYIAKKFIPTSKCSDDKMTCKKCYGEPRKEFDWRGRRK